MGRQTIPWNEASVISMTAFHGRGFFSAVFQPGDLQAAEAALALLRLLVAQDQASVYTRPYTPEGERPRWNVWG